MATDHSLTLTTQLEDDLRLWANILYENITGVMVSQALKRLLALAESAPTILLMLAEPWIEAKGHDPNFKLLLQTVAKIHLYARILDDALDENLPCHREALLRYQPLFFEAVYWLGEMFPRKRQQATALISTTVLAVREDDRYSHPKYWGEKNHHLLLLPLLCTDNPDLSPQVFRSLSKALAILQARDEWDQATVSDREIILSFISGINQQQMAECLHQAGFNDLAWKALNEEQSLLDRIKI